MENKIEIMAPAGNFETLTAAIKAGCDSVYFGVGKMNMRARAALNFKVSDLKKISNICKEKKVKTYLTLNIVVYDSEINEIKKIIDAAYNARIDAIIAHDFSVIQYARKKGLEVHLSTQANISNIDAVKFYSKYADVVVLARELNLEQIKNINKEIKKRKIVGPKGELIKTEIFVHGALCVSISGKCYMSLSKFNHSANRGDCFQPCRRAYRVIDEETGEELKLENKYVMSPKDLCTIGQVPELINSGVSVFKIEGRGKPPEYVYTVVKCYKEAVKSYYENSFTNRKVREWIKQLESVFNRGFWHGGYYLGKQTEQWAEGYGNQAKKQRVFLGKVRRYYPKIKVAEFVIETGQKEIKNDDEIFFTGKRTGIIKTTARNIYVSGKPSGKAGKNDEVTLKVPEKVRKGDEVYAFLNRFEYQGK